MNTPSITLSLEELTAALSLLGEAAAAKAFLWSYTGELSRDNERGRLVAAHHSLVARGVVRLTSDSLQLEPDLAETLRVVVAHQSALRFLRSAVGRRTSLVYYAAATGIVRHEIREDFLHTLSASTRDAITAEGLDFLEAPTTRAMAVASQAMAAEILQQASEAARADGASSAQAVLQAAHLSAPLSLAFGQDLAAARWRGSLLKILPVSGEPQGEAGLVFLRGQERLWTLNAQEIDGAAAFQVDLATRADLSRTIENLIP